MTKRISINIKYIFKYVITALLLIFFISATTANYDSFVNDLKKSGIDTDVISTSKTISRYTLTKLLNGVNCNDCMNPSANMINTYDYARWNNFSIGRDFKDISYL